MNDSVVLGIGFDHKVLMIQPFLKHSRENGKNQSRVYYTTLFYTPHIFKKNFHIGVISIVTN